MGVLEQLHQEHKERRARLENIVRFSNSAKIVAPPPITPPEPSLPTQQFPSPLLRLCPECKGTGHQLLEPVPMPPYPTMREICKLVSLKRGVAVRNLMGNRRDKKVAVPRHELMWLAYELTPHSFPVIAKYLQRDHTTIMHGCANTREKMAANEGYAVELNAMKDELLRSVGL